MSIFLLENIEKYPPRKLFTLFGVEYRGTRLWWLSLLWGDALCIGIAALFAPVEGVLAVLVTGLIYGTLLFLTSLLHSIGHIWGGKVAGAPMQANLITSTLNVNLYADTRDYPSRVHLLRALGGPLLNGLMVLLALLVYALWQSHFVVLFGVANLVYCLASLAPIDGLDGGVILRELRNKQT